MWLTFLNSRENIVLEKPSLSVLFQLVRLWLIVSDTWHKTNFGTIRFLCCSWLRRYAVWIWWCRGCAEAARSGCKVDQSVDYTWYCLCSEVQLRFFTLSLETFCQNLCCSSGKLLLKCNKCVKYHPSLHWWSLSEAEDTLITAGQSLHQLAVVGDNQHG